MVEQRGAVPLCLFSKEADEEAAAVAATDKQPPPPRTSSASSTPPSSTSSTPSAIHHIEKRKAEIYIVQVVPWLTRGDFFAALARHSARGARKCNSWVEACDSQYLARSQKDKHVKAEAKHHLNLFHGIVH